MTPDPASREYKDQLSQPSTSRNCCLHTTKPTELTIPFFHFQMFSL